MPRKGSNKGSSKRDAVLRKAQPKDLTNEQLVYLAGLRGLTDQEFDDLWREMKRRALDG